jgi:hypothetical protein
MNAIDANGVGKEIGTLVLSHTPQALQIMHRKLRNLPRPTMELEFWLWIWTESGG